MNNNRDDELDRLIRDTNDLIGSDDETPEDGEAWDYDQDEDQLEQESPPRATLADRHVSGRKKRRGCRGCFTRLLVVLVLVFVGVCGLWLVLNRQTKDDGAPASLSLPVMTSPAVHTANQTPANYTRKDGVTTILLAGTDGDGLRTDTIILLYIDAGSGQLGLLSIPRDTLVYGGYSVPKINSAYGWAGCGEAGMSQLMDRVQELVGYRPDRYIAISMDTLIQAVDLMGGVKFNVPMDMQYTDPWQDLTIDLRAGEQTLNGQQSMGLLRFRSGYATADLQRVQVQRDFLQAAMSQWLSLSGLTKLPSAMKLVREQALTDLNDANLLWLAKTFTAASLEGTTAQTLPGEGVNWSSGSYFVADPDAVLALVNQSFNIYDQALTWDALNIRTG